MTPHREPITTPEQVRQVAEILSRQDIIAFDTEFIRENTFYPKVEILQIATRDEAWIVDLQAFGPIRPNSAEKREAASSGPLKPLMDVFRDPKVLKVLHAAQADQECLYTSFGVVAFPSIDTAVAASLCGYGDGIGLGNLLKAVLGVSIKKGHARTNWSTRPLPPQLVEYALADVEHLVPAAERLLEELDKLGRRQWALELSARWENPKLYENDPEAIAMRLAKGGRVDKRGYAALLELARWREDRVRQLNLPRRWVADDNVLLDLAHVRPKDMEHLSTFRGLNKGELKASGEAILAALRRASEAKDVALPRLPRPEIPSAEEARVLDLLRCYMGLLADQQQIAAKYLAAGIELLPIIRGGATSWEELVRQDLMSEGAARLVGEEVVALLQGRRALSVRNGKMHVVRLDERK